MWQIWMVGAQVWTGHQGGVTPAVGGRVEDPESIGRYGNLATTVIGPSQQRPDYRGPYVVEDVIYEQTGDAAGTVVITAYVHLGYPADHPESNPGAQH
jgi:hypothetical protein